MQVQLSGQTSYNAQCDIIRFIDIVAHISKCFGTTAGNEKRK